MLEPFSPYCHLWMVYQSRLAKIMLEGHVLPIFYHCWPYLLCKFVFSCWPYLLCCSRCPLRSRTDRCDCVCWCLRIRRLQQDMSWMSLPLGQVGASRAGVTSRPGQWHQQRGRPHLVWRCVLSAISLCLWSTFLVPEFKYKRAEVKYWREITMRWEKAEMEFKKVELYIWFTHFYWWKIDYCNYIMQRLQTFVLI